MSLTVHLVLVTAHTNSSVCSVTRLTAMGAEPFVIGASLPGVLAQRLVRKLWPACKRQDERGAVAPGGQPSMPLHADSR